MENTVRYETDGKKLTAFFEGKVNATNAAGIEKELLEQADGKEDRTFMRSSIIPGSQISSKSSGH